MKNDTTDSNVVDFQDIKKRHFTYVRPPMDLRACEIDLHRLPLSPEQRDQFLEALWSIILAFVDLGYGVHPTQRVFVPKESASGIVAELGEVLQEAA
ncbi:hypothetical protein [Rhodovulum adriaticum]|uniref:Uncharacterized protein n=1 Tax=Rhodovulum adriaticum TaxID=35804 RepID=A0A4R2NL41_RHOAD|nr:hypothetical protein [Rhodovulum adriaticum]MBK1635143.1 hypothetical protein [Rhodovulum adriaticum]TCP22257.1 hypothetical protein EV656_10765 [Rhodovulum adriaticum]